LDCSNISSRRRVAKHPEVTREPRTDTERLVLLGVIERHPLVQVHTRGGEFPSKKQGLAECPGGHHEEGGGRLPLGKPEELLAHLPGRLQFRPDDIPRQQAPQDEKELGGVLHVMAQRPGTDG
jgi:hypothetical protein